MSVIVILILASLVLALLFLAGFVWAVKSGQFDDTYTPSMRILSDDPASASQPSLPATKLNAKPTYCGNVQIR